MDKVREIIDQALYGAPEIKPEERNLFLTTILERVYLALTKKQVVNRGMYEEALTLMKSKNNINLYINGDLSYGNFSNYIQEASKHGVSFTVVNPTKPTPFGLVLADKSEAINYPSIFVKDDLYEQDMEQTLT